MFAVAVFLFGYSLTPQGRRRRRLFTRVATLFVVVGGGWAIYSLAQGIPNLSATSSRAYANGLVEFNDAEYASADKDLKLATKSRPNFADAWSQLAQDRAHEGIPAQYVDNETTQVNDLGELRATAYADQQAIDAGSQSALVRFDLGATLLYIGLLDHNDNAVRQSRAESADAMARFLILLHQRQNRGEYLLFSEFNTAEADLVDGSPSARREYGAAVQHLLDPEFQNVVGVEPTVANALNDLNLIAQTRPRLAAETNALAQDIVYAVSHDTNDGWDATAHPHHDHPHFSAIQIIPDPGHLQYLIGKASQFDPSSDMLSVQWEYRDPVNHNWEVLPGISGAVEDGNTNTLTPNPPGYPTGTYLSSNPSFLGETSPHTCLPPGQYRAVLYADGRLAGVSSTVTASWGALQGTGFGAIGVAFCRPPTWRGFATSRAADADAFFSPDGSGGALLFGYPAKALSGLPPEQVMRLIVAGLSAGHGPVSQPFPVGNSRPSYFMNLNDARKQLWGYTASGRKIGVMWSATGTSPDGEIYVGLVYGPASSTQASIEKVNQQMLNILLSYSQL